MNDRAARVQPTQASLQKKFRRREPSKVRHNRQWQYGFLTVRSTKPVFLICVLMRAGDVERNPGPISFCGACKKNLSALGAVSGRSSVRERALFQFLLSKYRVLCLICVLLRLNARCYAVKYEEQICLELTICSPRQISLHYDNVK